MSGGDVVMQWRFSKRSLDAAIRTHVECDDAHVTGGYHIVGVGVRLLEPKVEELVRPSGGYIAHCE